jgi:hypothetical protein
MVIAHYPRRAPYAGLARLTVASMTSVDGVSGRDDPWLAPGVLHRFIDQRLLNRRDGSEVAGYA